MRFRNYKKGFTLLELLVVLVIIGLLAAISLPSLKNIRQSNTMVSAGRQLVDDLALARARAISERTTVHVVFVPSEIMNWTFGPDPKDAKLGERLKSGQYTSYALFADRSVGDQPGRARKRYLTQWKSLPNGVFIPTNLFQNNSGLRFSEPVTNRPLEYVSIPFPTINGLSFELPHVAFDPQGKPIIINSSGTRIVEDEVISLARGSILYSRNSSGTLDEFDVRESPPGNSLDSFHRIRINGLTGRATVETPSFR